jgi:energy-converting hydrogenase Eha subunit C
MAASPIGRYEWGYVWSDTLVAGPALLIGGIAVLLRSQPVRRIGQLLAFAGFAINLYAMIGIWIGFRALGRPMQGALLWANVALTAAGVLCMAYLGTQLARGNRGCPQ